MKPNKPSATATLIARSQILLAETQGWAVDAGYLAQYRCFVTENNALQRAFLKLTEIFAIPGLYLHFALRKKLIESIVQSQIEKGAVQQVVVIAAGLDPLVAALHKTYPQIRFYELDHPATQVIKMDALTDAESNLFFCPADLTKTALTDALAPAWFDANQPTVFIAEGITMYLDAKQIDKFFAGIRALSQHPDSSLIFTYMARSPLGVIGFDSQTWLARLWLQLQGEPMKWGIEPENIAGFLAARGFKLNRDHSAADLSARFMPAGNHLRTAKGENICWAGISNT